MLGGGDKVKQRPEDNKYFHYYNANPKGKETKDCVYRALSLFLDKSWDEIARMDAEFYLTHGTFLNHAEEAHTTEGSGTEIFLNESDDCEMVYSFDLRDGIGTMRDFIDKMAEPEKTYICPLVGHIAVIKDMKVWDTWDSSNSGVHNVYELKSAT